MLTFDHLIEFILSIAKLFAHCSLRKAKDSRMTPNLVIVRFQFNGS